MEIRDTSGKIRENDFPELTDTLKKHLKSAVNFCVIFYSLDTKLTTSHITNHRFIPKHCSTVSRDSKESIYCSVILFDPFHLTSILRLSSPY